MPINVALEHKLQNPYMFACHTYTLSRTNTLAPTSSPAWFPLEYSVEMVSSNPNIASVPNATET